MRFEPVIPSFAQALATFSVMEFRAKTQDWLQEPSKSDGWQPLMVWVYTELHADGRFDTRGVKSERVTARAAGSAKSAATGDARRMTIVIRRQTLICVCGVVVMLRASAEGRKRE